MDGCGSMHGWMHECMDGSMQIKEFDKEGWFDPCRSTAKKKKRRLKDRSHRKVSKPFKLEKKKFLSSRQILCEDEVIIQDYKAYENGNCRERIYCFGKLLVLP